MRYATVSGQEPPIAVSKLLIGLNAFSHVAGDAEELEVVDLVAATATKWILVVYLKVVHAMGMTTVGAFALLCHEELVLYASGEDDPAPAPVAGVIVPL